MSALIAFTGPQLKGRLDVTDDTISDGEARFVLWQTGVKSRIGRRDGGGLTVKVEGKPSRLIFTLSAPAGTFTELSGPTIAGRALEVVAVEAPPPTPTPAPAPTQAPTQQPAGTTTGSDPKIG